MYRIKWWLEDNWKDILTVIFLAIVIWGSLIWFVFYRMDLKMERERLAREETRQEQIKKEKEIKLSKPIRLNKDLKRTINVMSSMNDRIEEEISYYDLNSINKNNYTNIVDTINAYLKLDIYNNVCINNNDISTELPTSEDNINNASENPEIKKPDIKDEIIKCIIESKGDLNSVNNLSDETKTLKQDFIYKLMVSNNNERNIIKEYDEKINQLSNNETTKINNLKETIDVMYGINNKRFRVYTQLYAMVNSGDSYDEIELNRILTETNDSLNNINKTRIILKEYLDENLDEITQLENNK